MIALRACFILFSRVIIKSNVFCFLWSVLIEQDFIPLRSISREVDCQILFVIPRFVPQHYFHEDEVYAELLKDE